MLFYRVAFDSCRVWFARMVHATLKRVESGACQQITKIDRSPLLPSREREPIFVTHLDDTVVTGEWAIVVKASGFG